MGPVIRRIRQFAIQSPGNIVWVIYVVGIALWMHRAARPLHILSRWHVRRRRQMDPEPRLELLRLRLSRCAAADDSLRIGLAALSPELDEICRPLRQLHREIPLADIDQDGFLCPRLGKLWAAPQVDADAFLPRPRFGLTVVDCGGWVGVRKEFRGDKMAFANELEAALELRTCNVPALLRVDFERLAITFSYIDGAVVRETLAQAGAPMRERDVKPSLSALRTRIRYYRLDKKRIVAGRRIIDQAFDQDTIARIGEALLAIHRAGYVLQDVKYGNIIVDAKTKRPYFIDYEQALPLRAFSTVTATYLRDRDAEKLNRLFGTKLLTAKTLRRSSIPGGDTIYAPFYAGAGLWWGAIWNPDIGPQRWRYMLAQNVPVPRGGRVLDLGANNGFNALQMLRAGAAEVVGVEIEPAAIKQGLFVKRVFEWADNRHYRFSYIQGSHADVASMNLGRFDLITAFCTLYYLSGEEMARTVSSLARMSDILVLQCNEERWIERSNTETFTKASLSFNMELVRDNGFRHVTAIRRPGSDRPLVIARTRVDGGEAILGRLRGLPIQIRSYEERQKGQCLPASVRREARHPRGRT